MSVQATLDSAARRLLREELQADSPKATARSDHRDIQALPLTDGLDPLSLLCGTQALLPAPRLSDDPDGSDAAALYPIQAGGCE